MATHVVQLFWIQANFKTSTNYSNIGWYQRMHWQINLSLTSRQEPRVLTMSVSKFIVYVLTFTIWCLFQTMLEERQLKEWTELFNFYSLTYGFLHLTGKSKNKVQCPVFVYLSHVCTFIISYHRFQCLQFILIRTVLQASVTVTRPEQIHWA